jgi:DtxR family Mn-dependent transcriptional regulator
MQSPAILLALGLLILLLLVLLFWPQQGLWARWRRMRRNTQRVLIEDALKHLYQVETRGERLTTQSLAGALQIHPNEAAGILTEMAQLDLVSQVGDCPQLTAEGAQTALQVIRAHRLWERYLAEETGFSEAEWHDQAEQREHRLTPEAADALAAHLGYPTHDPHGDPIPTAAGEIQPHGGVPLTARQPNDSLRIVHIEDEPEMLYAQLVAEGLYPGMQVRLVEITPRRVRFLADGEEHLLAPLVAANISVVPLEAEAPLAEEPQETLDSLPVGETAEVLQISRRVRRLERQRFMDLGILPGTQIEVELTGPVGDPRAYKVRGSVIALRKEQAQMISIRRLEEQM